MKHGITFLLTGLISVSIMTVLGFFIKSQTGSIQPDTVDQSQLQQAFLEREANYQAIIADANQRLEQANLDLRTLSNRVTQLQQSQQVSYPISSEKAIEVANRVRVGETPDPSVEMVDFEGTVAYEVRYGKGPVYIDAFNGSILYNSLDNSSLHQVTPEEAAKIASDYLGIYEIYQVDQITFKGEVLIRVIFTQGHMIYLNQSGQIVYVQKVTRYDASQAVSVSASSDDRGSSHSDDHDDDDDD